MALYTIGDTHLSLTSDKSMEVFGGGWEGYVDKLRKGFEDVRPEDTVVICGDVSWGMSLEESREDFAFLDALPGRKLLVKGNHDYWWNTASKMNAFFAQNGFESLSFIITVLFMERLRCVGPGAGFMRKIGANIAPRYLTGSCSAWRPR